MGTSHPAHTYVESEISSCSPGATIPGVVKILVDKQTHAEQMSIRLRCIGKSYWVARSNVDRVIGSRRSRTTYEAERTLLQLDFPIWNFGGNLPQGQFVLPFSIQLPTNLTPSFKHSSYNARGSIEYYLEAIVGDNKDIMPHPSVIWINRLPTSSHLISPVNAEISMKVSNCCCFKTGRASLKTTLNLNVATIADELSTTSQIDNSDNKYRIKSASCALIRKIRLRARQFLMPQSTFFSQQVISRTKPLSVRVGNSEVQHLDLGMSMTESPDLWMQPPVDSEVVECEYEVRVALDFDNFCGCGDYYLSFPLEICNGANVVHEKLSQPPNLNVEWSPMMLSEMRVHTADFSNIHTGQEVNHTTIAEPSTGKAAKSEDKSFTDNKV